MDGNDLSALELSGLGAGPGVHTCAETAKIEQVNQMKKMAATLGIAMFRVYYVFSK